MSKVKEFLAGLPDDKKALFAPVFGDTDRFYTVVYLIALNEHTTEMDKPDKVEQRLETIRYFRKVIEEMVDSYDLDGKEIVADIGSDYFEDYVNYREPELEMTHEEFMHILRILNS